MNTGDASLSLVRGPDRQASDCPQRRGEIFLGRRVACRLAADKPDLGVAAMRATYAALAVLALASCVAPAAAAITLNSLGCATSFDVVTDYFPVERRLDGSQIGSAQSVVRRPQGRKHASLQRCPCYLHLQLRSPSLSRTCYQVQVASLFQVAYRNSYKFAYSFATNETFVLYQVRAVPRLATAPTVSAPP